MSYEVSKRAEPSSSRNISSSVRVKSGSMARFGLYDKYRICDNNCAGMAINVQNPAWPVKLGNAHQSEHRNHVLYTILSVSLGTNSGMIIVLPGNPLVPNNDLARRDAHQRDPG